MAGSNLGMLACPWGALRSLTLDLLSEPVTDRLGEPANLPATPGLPTPRLSQPPAPTSMLAAPMRFHESTFSVYFDDLDSFGILHNARYLLYMERCIGEFWRKLGWAGFHYDRAPDQFHLVRENQVEYLRPFEGEGKLRVRLTVTHIGQTSLVFSFQIMSMEQDIALATGRRVVVCVDPQDRSKRPWSQMFRDKLRPYVAQ